LVRGLKVSIVESQFTRPRNSTMLDSVPLGLKFDSSPCSNSSSCVTHITLHKSSHSPSSAPPSVHRGLKVNTTSESDDIVEVTCEEGDYSSSELTCGNGDVVILSCNGSSGVWSRVCPIHNISNVCSSFLENENYQYCKVISESFENISCECSLMNDHTQGDDTVTGVSSVSLNFGVVSRSLVHEFLNTWRSADTITASMVAHNLTVLFSTASVAMLGVALMVIAHQLDKRDEKIALSKKAKDAIDLQDPSARPSSSLLVKSVSYLQRSISSSNFNSKPRHHRKALVKHNIVGLNEERRIEDSLPFVMRPVPLLDKCKNEMVMYHRWAGVYFHYSSAYSRSMRVLTLWVNVVIMLFIQSVTYTLADPDDGSCEKKTSMEGCLSLKSSLSNGNQCSWNGETGECSFRPIDHDFNRVLIVAVLSGVLSTPFSILFQSLILFVLSAKTKSANADEMLTSSRMSHIARQTRFQTQQGRKTMLSSPNLNPNQLSRAHSSLASCRVDLSTTLQEDLGLLSQRVRLYRRELRSLDEIEQFECKLILLLHPLSLLPPLLSLLLTLWFSDLGSNQHRFSSKQLIPDSCCGVRKFSVEIFQEREDPNGEHVDGVGKCSQDRASRVQLLQQPFGF
jgi:hypothetical protein